MTKLLFRSYTTPLNLYILKLSYNDRQQLWLPICEKDKKVVVNSIVGMPSKYGPELNFVKSDHYLQGHNSRSIRQPFHLFCTVVGWDHVYLGWENLKNLLIILDGMTSQTYEKKWKKGTSQLTSWTTPINV